MVNFIVHPGFAKTGTTFFQKIILSKTNKTLNIGKPYNQNLNIKKILYNKNLDKKKVLKFSKDLVNLIKKNKIKNIVLSDESILDYEFYDPTKNIKFLRSLINETKKKIKINLTFLLTIRKQENLLISRYAYLYPKFKKDYPQFINYINIKEKRKNQYFDILNFYKTGKKIKTLFKCKIIFLPLEYLEFEPNKYIKIINKLLSIKINQKIFFKNRINENKYKNQNILRTGNLWFNMYNYLSNSNKIKKFADKFKKNLIYNFTRKMIYKNIKFNKSKNLYELDEKLKKEIKKIYLNDNKKLKFYSNKS